MSESHPYPRLITKAEYNYSYFSGVGHVMADPRIEYRDHRQTVKDLEEAEATLRRIAEEPGYYDDWGESTGGYSGVDVHTSTDDIVSASESARNAALNLHNQHNASLRYFRSYIPS